MPFSDISVTTAAFAMSHEPKIIGSALRGPPSRAYHLHHATITITKWFLNMGSCPGSCFCLFGQVLRVLLAQIVLGSDYSGSIKNYSDYFTSFEKRLIV